MSSEEQHTLVCLMECPVCGKDAPLGTESWKPVNFESDGGKRIGSVACPECYMKLPTANRKPLEMPRRGVVK